MKNKICILFFSLLTILFSACINLEETMYDQLTPKQYTPNNDDPVGIIYSSLMGSAIAPYTFPGSEFLWFIQTSTDEVCVPIRKGGDWKDGYVFQQLQKHTWDANNKVVLAAWNYYYNIIGVCNVELKKKKYSLNQLAQIRLVRAYAYLGAMDLFGNIPIVDENQSQSQMPVNSSRGEVYNFVRDELNDTIMNNLRNRKTSEVWGKSILNVLKARLYLNSQVYTGCSDVQYNLNLDSCIMSCDNIINSNKYQVTDYYRSFYVDNDLLSNAGDIICALSYKPTEGTVGNYLQMLSFAKGTQCAFGVPVMSNVVNGVCVNPGTSRDDPNALYNIFDTKDIRRLSIFSTQIKFRYNAAGEPLSTDDPTYNQNVREGGSTKIFMPLLHYDYHFQGGFSEWNSIADDANAAERGAGARILKYEIVPSTAWEMENDLVLMRYTEVLYTKAEALIRLGRGTEAIPLFEEVLSKRGYDGRDVGYGVNDITIEEALSKRNIATENLFIPIIPDLDFMEKEWRREFIFENRRRTDMIRFGSFFNTWGIHETASSQTKALFPIPADIMARNPNLVQNIGYQ